MALSRDRDTAERQGNDFIAPVAAGVKIHAGSIVVLDSSGNAKPAVTATGLIPAGRAEEAVDNTLGAAGAVTVNFRRGVFCYTNSTAADEITRAEIGDVCHLVDDQTVAKTDGSNTRSKGGFIVDVEDGRVWVLLGYGLLQSASGAVLTANNLSDLASASTSRANLGVNKAYIQITVTTLVGTGVYYAVSPLGGTITKVWSVIEGVLTTGDATLTGKINGTGITGGVITITQSGSAAGDVDSATPSALNTVVAGNTISMTVGGTNATATVAKVMVEITH